MCKKIKWSQLRWMCTQQRNRMKHQWKWCCKTRLNNSLCYKSDWNWWKITSFQCFCFNFIHIMAGSKNPTFNEYIVRMTYIKYINVPSIWVIRDFMLKFYTFSLVTTNRTIKYTSNVLLNIAMHNVCKIITMNDNHEWVRV